MQAINTEIEVICNTRGRFVRLQQLGAPRQLALREVEFYTGTFAPVAFSDTVGCVPPACALLYNCAACVRCCITVLRVCLR